MDETFVTERWGLFRASAKPTVPLPFGLRSMGRYQFAEVGMIEDLKPRGFAQIYWCAQGRVGFGDGQTEIAVSPGEVFAYTSQHGQRLRALSPQTRYWWFTIDGPLADSSLAHFGLTAPWPKSAGPVPERLFQRLGAVITDPSQGSERAAAALGWELLSAAASGGTHEVDQDESVGRLRRLLIERSSDPDLSVSRLAAELDEDRSVLTRRFTRIIGVAPKPFLQSLRLGRAMSLLHATSAPVSAIARDCGFADPGYFARAFRERTGLTPERFRKG
jgi:AraC-like DNA-binding protein